MTSPSSSAPRVDSRSHQAFVDQTTELAEHFSGWRAPQGGSDLGLALIELFAGMAEQVAAHLNRVPDRDRLAFLELIGIQPLPAQSARVPVTFALADGQTTAFVPAATVVATPALAGMAEIQYETERDLTLTAVKLVAAQVRDPANDRRADVTAAATGATPDPWRAFIGDSLIEHAVYVGHDRFIGLPRPRTLAVVVSGVDGAARQAFESLPLEWSWWDGEQWQPATATVTTRDDTTAVVSLGDIPHVTPTPLFGSTSRWLRARLTRAIQLVGPIPALRNVSVAVVRNAGPSVAPDHAFANTAELDLSRDAYPFGEAPRYNDVFLLASDVFSQSGASVTIHVDVSSGLPVPVAPSADLVIAWEVGSTTGWVEVGRSGPGAGEPAAGFSDQTEAFRMAGDVTFTLPAVGDGLTLNGVTGAWLRARIVRGDYGKPAHTTGQPPTFVAANLAPPSIRSLAVTWSLTGEERAPICLTANDDQWADVTAAARGEGDLVAFAPSPETQPALNLGFDAPFPNRPLLLYFQIEPQPYDPNAPAATTQGSGAVRWENRTASGWSPLDVIDETEAFSRSGLVGFVGPAGAVAAEQFGQSLWWLRVRPGAAGATASAQIRRVLTNTVWAANASAHSAEPLGISDGSPSQIWSTTQAPMLGDEVIEVAEASSSAVPVAATGSPDAVWTLWLAVPDFSTSGPDDRQYVVDHQAGTIGFGDGRRGRVPPSGSAIRATYRTGGGAVGNGPAATITQLKSALAGVTGVTNLEPAGGGADAESVDRVQERGPRLLRHGERAVAAADYEDLAREASAEVARAAALPPTVNPLDLDWLTPTPVTPPDPAAPPVVNQSILCRADAAVAAARSNLPAGRVAVVVTPNDDVPQPAPSAELLDEVRRAVLARCPAVLGSADVAIVGPEWLQLTAHAEVAPVSLDVAAAVPASVVAALSRFLHPLQGGVDGTGWPFGRLPHLSDLYAVISAVPGVDHVRTLSVDLLPDPATLPAERLNRTLVWSGLHEVTLAARADSSSQSGPPA